MSGKCIRMYTEEKHKSDDTRNDDHGYDPFSLDDAKGKNHWGWTEKVKASATAFVSQTRSRFRWKETAEVGTSVAKSVKFSCSLEWSNLNKSSLRSFLRASLEFHISCHLFGFFNEDFIEHFLDEFSFSLHSSLSPIKLAKPCRYTETIHLHSSFLVSNTQPKTAF